MRSLALLLCLAQLWGCRSVPVGPTLAYNQPNCDDPETEQAALAAVDYINSHVLRGYKHTLNQIDKVKVWPQQPVGEVFELEIDTLETTCHVLDPTPLANCTVRQLVEHAVEGDCDFRVLKQDGQFSVVFSKCDSSPDSAEDVRKVCPDCPLLAPLNDIKVVHAVDVALTAFNAQSNGSYFQLVEVSRAQLVPLPPSTYVEFAVAATDCAAQEATDPAQCNLLAEKQYGFCKATLTEKVGGEDVAVTCTVFQPQPQPDGPDAVALAPVADPAAPAPSPADRPAAALVVGPMVVAVPEALLPGHRRHYDLRHAFMGVGSVESASGETFHVGKAPKVVQPGIVAGPGPVVRPCPGRIRYFKV
ncbi:PREDICTED: alpha-2-HS-glycoprotein isoform X2 [Odobenus rosmarus divergens]|uniref:Alpha-2-HS-glycoprotein n=1 Tax=Odobenus rosmarus divergens TaxID=9708 RepID=A0A2U3WVG5_ODORO|nr:PREDICTED: alpha-2-HS-glycoprotein isoform X2 [Odobenus rosmarus divergens]